MCGLHGGRTLKSSYPGTVLSPNIVNGSHRGAKVLLSTIALATVAAALRRGNWRPPVGEDMQKQIKTMFQANLRQWVEVVRLVMKSYHNGLALTQELNSLPYGLQTGDGL